LFFKDQLSGPKAWAKVGYRRVEHTMPLSTAGYLGSYLFNSPALGVGAEVPLFLKISAFLDLNIGVASSVLETGLGSGTAGGVSDIGFQVGATYSWDERIKFRAVFDLDTQSATFEDSGSILLRTLSVVPSMTYSF
jgi:hypothetical protein